MPSREEIAAKVAEELGLARLGDLYVTAIGQLIPKRVWDALIDAKVELAERENSAKLLGDKVQQYAGMFGPLDAEWNDATWTRNQLVLANEHCTSAEQRVKELSEALSKIHRWLVCAPIASTEDFMSGVVDMELTARAVLSEGSK